MKDILFLISAVIVSITLGIVGKTYFEQRKLANAEAFLQSQGCINIGPPTSERAKPYFSHAYLCDNGQILVPILK